MSLAAAYLPLARSMALKLARGIGRDDLRDDLESDALLAMVEAERDHDPSLAPYRLYARRRARWAMLDRLRADRCHRKCPTVALPASPDLAPLSREPDPWRALDEADAAEALLRSLPRDAATALRLVGLEGLTWAVAADRMGVTTSEVGRRLKLCRALLYPEDYRP